MDCITFTAPVRGRSARPPEGAGAQRTQALYVSTALKTARVMVKDEDVCLHCGLCAERCPTGAWDMQKFLLLTPKAGPGCRGANPTQPSAWESPHEQHQETHRSRQRLRHQVRQRQRLGLGLGQRAVCQGGDAHGRAGEPAQHLPQQHPGHADLVRGAGVRKGLPRPPRRRGHDGGDEPADLGARTWPRSSPAATCSTTARARCRPAACATT
jgi:NAD-dependent dihydropyrimidine dehydrogenase PreA subunit